MEPKKKETEVTYWHPAFYADIQIELIDDADNLTFENGICSVPSQIRRNPMKIAFGNGDCSSDLYVFVRIAQ